MIREATDDDAPSLARLSLAADDARVISAEAILHMRRTRPERERALELVAEADGTVVGLGKAALDVWTTTQGASWAVVTVTTTWQISWTGSGGSGGTLPAMTRSGTFDLAVAQRQTVVTGGSG